VLAVVGEGMATAAKAVFLFRALMSAIGHLADIPSCTAHVRFQGKSGQGDDGPLPLAMLKPRQKSYRIPSGFSGILKGPCGLFEGKWTN